MRNLDRINIARISHGIDNLSPTSESGPTRDHTQCAVREAFGISRVIKPPSPQPSAYFPPKLYRPT